MGALGFNETISCLYSEVRPSSRGKLLLILHSIILQSIILYSPTFVTRNLKLLIMDIQNSVRDTGQQVSVDAFVGVILLFVRMA